VRLVVAGHRAHDVVYDDLPAQGRRSPCRQPGGARHLEHGSRVGAVRGPPIP
jgi:hypothetical protein